jgi:hypothetical protein
MPVEMKCETCGQVMPLHQGGTLSCPRCAAAAGRPARASGRRRVWLLLAVLAAGLVAFAAYFAHLWDRESHQHLRAAEEFVRDTLAPRKSLDVKEVRLSPAGSRRFAGQVVTADGEVWDVYVAEKRSYWQSGAAAGGEWRETMRGVAVPPPERAREEVRRRFDRGRDRKRPTEVELARDGTGYKGTATVDSGVRYAFRIDVTTEFDQMGVTFTSSCEHASLAPWLKRELAGKYGGEEFRSVDLTACGEPVELPQSEIERLTTFRHPAARAIARGTATSARGERYEVEVRETTTTHQAPPGGDSILEERSSLSWLATPAKKKGG